MTCDQLRHPRVGGGGLGRVAPAVEGEVHQGEPTLSVPHNEWPVVAHPRVVELGLDQLDPG